MTALSLANPVLALPLTIGIFLGMRRMEARWPWWPSLLAASCLTALAVSLTGTPYRGYASGTSPLTFLLGPATVALAVPLYRHGLALKHRARPILAGVAAGSVTGMAVSAGVAWALGARPRLILTLMPKAATTPIAVGVIHGLGGLVSLGAAFTVLTGLIGSLLGPPLLRRLGFRSPLAEAVAIGNGASGIGTARMLRESDWKGSVSSLAMALTGILITLLALLVRLGGR
jgi:putative effector of murein hydrolase